MFVDDNKVNRKIAKQLFATFSNLRCFCAQNADECLKKLKLRKFDMVIIDYEMPPGLNGCATAKKWLDENPTSNIPFILHTSNEITDALQLEANNHNIQLIISKTLTPLVLTSLFKRFLKE